jgi:hypothetical protein
MLVIRKAQIKVLEQAARRSFEDRMVGYLSKRFPDTCGAHNEAAVRASIQKGIEQAKRYGITAEYDVARYIDLMLEFSEDFDTSPATSWATPILTNANLGFHAKMDLLWEKAIQDPHCSRRRRTGDR